MNKIWKCLGATVDDRVAEGQPFFPTQKAGDPEREYPLTLQEGVPLGVDEPTLTFPELSPAKEELSGAPEKWEELASPTGRDSAEAFADSIKERHSLRRERERWDWWSAPSQNRKRQRCVDAIQVNYAQVLWQL